MGEARDIAQLAEQAGALGIDASAARALGASDDADYAAALPVLSDLSEALSAVGPDRADAANRLRAAVDRAVIDLLGVERGAALDQREDFDSLPRASFDALKAEYEQLFATCETRPERASLVAWHVRQLTKGREAYEHVGGRLGIPWYFVGIVHGLEAGFRFTCHLHNGDPLSHRTVQHPSGRPPAWNPPTDWESSAIDALTYEGFAGRADWSLTRTLYRWEAYNGFGSRSHGVHTPYLWSFSEHYDRGKYASDGHWDPHLVSAQCGAAVMLKALIDGGQAAPPPNA